MHQGQSGFPYLEKQSAQQATAERSCKGSSVRVGIFRPSRFETLPIHRFPVGICSCGSSFQNILEGAGTIHCEQESHEEGIE